MRTSGQIRQRIAAQNSERPDSSWPRIARMSIAFSQRSSSGLAETNKAAKTAQSRSGTAQPSNPARTPDLTCRRRP